MVSGFDNFRQQIESASRALVQDFEDDLNRLVPLHRSGDISTIAVEVESAFQQHKMTPGPTDIEEFANAIRNGQEIKFNVTTKW